MCFLTQGLPAGCSQAAGWDCSHQKAWPPGGSTPQVGNSGGRRQDASVLYRVDGSTRLLEHPANTALRFHQGK